MTILEENCYRRGGEGEAVALIVSENVGTGWEGGRVEWERDGVVL